MAVAGMVPRRRMVAVLAAAGLAIVGMVVAAPSAQATASACDAVAGNLVANCGFETGDFTDWSDNGPLDRVVSIVDWVHSGNYGAYMGQVGRTSTLSQALSGTSAGTTYSFSYWMDDPTNGGPPDSFEAQVSNVVGGPLIFDAVTDVGALPWAQFTHTFTTLSNGTAPTISFVARNDPEAFGVDDVVVTPVPPPTKKPSFTSAAAATFTAGSPGSFTVTTKVDAAHGTATLSCPSCTLPTGVTFTPGPGGTATIAGLVGSDGGIFPITIKATNSVGTTTQVFTLTVDQAPVLSGPNTLTFTVGASGSVAYTASGYPGPVTIGISSGTRPAGLSLSTPQTTTGAHGLVSTSVMLVGSPSPGSGGVYDLTLVASNGILPDATLAVTITVYEAPHFTSTPHTTFTALHNNTFQVTATGGYPPGPLTYTTTGPLPAGVALSTSGLLSGTPPVSESGYHHFTITVSNGHASTTQAFVLFIRAPRVPGAALVAPGQPTTALSADHECVTWTLTGYAPYAPVTVIAYPRLTSAVPYTLGTFTAGFSGRLNLDLCLPDSARGAYDLLAAGYATNGSINYQGAWTIVQP